MAKNATDFNELIKSIDSVDTTDFGREFRDIVGPGNASDLSYFLDIISRYEQALEMSGAAKWFVPGTPFSIEHCPKHRAFFEAGKKYHERFFLAGNRCGKSLPLSELVMTPNGPVTMGSLAVGDEVVGSNGLATTITGYYPQGQRPVYKLTASDNSSILCDEEHLWTVRNTAKGASGKYETLTTKQLLASNNTWALPPRPVVYYKARDLPIDPYLLGLLIGDGGLTNTVMFTTEDEELVEFCSKIAPVYNCSLRSRGKYCYQFSSEVNNRHGKSYNMLYDILTGLELNCLSKDKRIPREYLLSSEEDRLALLQGLMDTDGTCGKEGQAVFYSVSKGLCEDVAELVRSLGCNATVSQKNGKYKDQPHVSWLTTIRRTSRFIPFRLSRKANRYKAAKIKERAITIKSIEFVGTMDCACITVDAPDSLFLAGEYLVTHNSVSGALETAYHLTGDYPIWWNGKVFDKPVHGWAVGPDAKTTRDTVQKELLGPIGAWGTGVIPKDRILRSWSLSGVPQGVDTVEIRHKSGGVSTIAFKNYEQDIKAFYGTAKDFIWLDEECPDNIYNECLLRTMTTNGIVYCTFTPLHGLTPLVVRFCRAADFLAGSYSIKAIMPEKSEDELELEKIMPQTSKAVVTAGWDDAPWLPEDAKRRMLDDTSPHLRDARSKGIPAMGSGNVYPISLDEVLCDPFDIPANWRRMYALDVGWNKTACVWAAIDPNSDTVYIYDEHYMGEQPPAIHAEAIRSRGAWINGVVDPASRGRSQVDGQSLMNVYKQLGLKLTPAKNEVEGGIQNCWHRFTTGKLKIFKNCYNLQKEFVLYRRDEKGRIIKENDHAMDAMRYVINNLNRARARDFSGVTSGPYTGTRHYNI